MELQQKEIKMTMFHQEAGLNVGLRTHTDNGDVGFTHIGFDTLDQIATIFSKVGNLKSGNSVMEKTLLNVLPYNKDMAYRLLQYIRDTRQGFGCKKFYYNVMSTLITTYGITPEIDKMLSKTFELGYFKDYLQIASNLKEKSEIELAHYVLAKYYVPHFVSDDKMTRMNAFKYAPRWRNTFKEFIPLFMFAFGLISKDTFEVLKNSTNANVNKLDSSLFGKYQKIVSANSDTIEQKITRNESFSVDYFSTVPSRALSRHRKFLGKLPVYQTFLGSLAKGEVKVNTGAVSFVELATALLSSNGDVKNDASYLQKLNTLTLNHDIIPVVDLSGSMSSGRVGTFEDHYITPKMAALGLGVAVASANKSKFKDLVMTFSEKPQFVDISKEKTAVAKLKKVERSCNDLSTDIDKTIQLVLDTAKKFNLSEKDMPKFLVYFTDCQFDVSGFSGNIRKIDDHFLARAKKEYANCGYEMPQVVFWNLNTHLDSSLPITKHDTGVVCVSGYNHVIMNTLFEGTLDPVASVVKVLMNPRYDL